MTFSPGATPMLVIAATPASLDAIPPRRASVELRVPPNEDELDFLRGIVAQYRTSGVRLLVDLREDDMTEVPGENVQAFATFLGSLEGDGPRRVGILTSIQPVYHDLARMVETYVDRAGLEVACFYDAEDAMGWVRS